MSRQGPRDQEFTNGAAHVAASMDNLVKKVNGDGAYAATIRGIWVAAAPTAADTSITVNGTALTSIPAAAFSVGQVYPIDATSVTVGTDGVFYIWIA